MISSISEAYRRWRHTRGYGVHSPFAFRIVSDIIRSPYEYYGYHDIDAALEKSSSQKQHCAEGGSPTSPPKEALRHNPRRLRRHARFLLRLTNFIQPSQVFLFTEAPAPFRTAIRAASPSAVITDQKQAAAGCSLIISDAATFSIRELRQIISRPAITLWLRSVNTRQAQSLLSSISQGIAFIAPRDILILTRPGLTPVSYTINL